MIRIFNIDHNDFAAEVANGNVSVNLTQMAKPFGKSKQPFEWLRTREAREYITALIGYKSTQNSRPGNSGLTENQEVSDSKNSKLKKSSLIDNHGVGDSKSGRVGKSTLPREAKLTEGLITVKNGGSPGEHGTWAHV
jgi:hypothetical protein